MLTSVWAKVTQGKIEPLEPTTLPEGATVLVTIFPGAEVASTAESQTDLDVQSSDQSMPDAWEEAEEDSIWDTAPHESGQPFLPQSDSSPLMR